MVWQCYYERWFNNKGNISIAFTGSIVMVLLNKIKLPSPKKESNMSNITLLIGNSGFKLSIAQGVDRLNRSGKDHHVEVALLDSVGFFVNSGHWWHDATHKETPVDFWFDDVVSHINADDLQKVIIKATAWVTTHDTLRTSTVEGF